MTEASLDGDTGVVTDFGPAIGQLVEYGRLAGVGITGDNNGRVLFGMCGCHESATHRQMACVFVAQR